MGQTVHGDTTHDTVGHDLKCRRCGYNLRGLSWQGNCPECALEVIRSTGERWLSLSDVRWLRVMQRGHLAVVGAAVLLFGGMIGFAFVFQSFPRAPVELVATLWFGGSALIACIGMWLMATADQSGASLPSEERVRRCARVWVAIFGCGVLVLTLSAAIGGSRFQLLDLPTFVLVTITRVAAILALHYLARWLRSLAHRAVRPTLVDFCAALVWGVPMVGFVAVAMSVAQWLPKMLDLSEAARTMFDWLAMVRGATVTSCAGLVATPMLMLIAIAAQAYVGRMLADEIAIAEARERVTQGLQPERPPRGALERERGD